ncbi:MAG: DUF2334 domain-containing protein [Caldimicrobium sp.]|nr:DUF2334 domain-containing protein [Caldimicrobium sp.]MCX7613055.1 DUF2334 domain-containing protein [Caldimicrobium sp.]MDW8182794.1 DUF2334 domain-containing protein [Caldimicrobium sp.]
MQLAIIELHDVNPIFSNEVERALELFSRHKLDTFSLLVVPNYHGRSSLFEKKAFVNGLKSLEKAELILHGYSHRGVTPLTQRIWTSGEGEFATLTAEETMLRLCKAQAEICGTGLKCEFFVPPAWIGNPYLEEFLQSLGYKGIAYRFYIKLFNPCQRIFSPVITFSNRWGLSYLSLLSAKALLVLYKRFAIIRLALHCADFSDGRKISLWEAILSDIKRKRRIIHYGDLLSQSGLTLAFQSI